MVADGKADRVERVCEFGPRQGGTPRLAAAAYQAGGAACTDEWMRSGDGLGVAVVGDEETSARAQMLVRSARVRSIAVRVR